ncbi:MAG: SDR family NAD(P)-dependent oxidoreductase [Rhodospirillaceae bacterium]|nr:SDR family NAD(P)-dependent oxidoreductase [Rhodospirillaceae bacterium]MBT7267551.1 SDR family NAD(P)-dependent oxidoreductase [Rhodospirillaceae bacterium]
MKIFKSILITGASSGIGKALAEQLAGEGVYLAISGRDQARLNEVGENCRKKGATVDATIIDVTNQAAMKSWLEEIDSQHSLDLVIANAGVSPGTSGETRKDDQMRRMLEINVIGVLNTIDPVIPGMIIRESGSIALMSSLAGFRGLPSAPGYGASKAWVRSYGEGLRGSLHAEGINVSVICPGFVASRITDQNKFPMPFFMTAPKAAAIILHGLDKNKARIAFPLASYIMAWLLAFLPLWLTDLLARKLPRKE